MAQGKGLSCHKPFSLSTWMTSLSELENLVLAAIGVDWSAMHLGNELSGMAQDVQSKRADLSRSPWKLEKLMDLPTQIRFSSASVSTAAPCMEQ